MTPWLSFTFVSTLLVAPIPVFGTPPPACTAHLLTVEPDGAVSSGSKDALRAAFRAGLPLRVGWGFQGRADGRDVSVEHAAEPDFVSIVGGAELFAHLPEHIAQVAYHDAERAVFENASVMWRGLLGTTGAFDAVKLDRATGAEVWRRAQKARVAWFALAPEQACAPPATDLAVPGGVFREVSTGPSKPESA